MCYVILSAKEISALEWRSAVWCCCWSCCCVADYKSPYADLNVNSRIWIDFEWNASADKCSPPRKHQPASQLSNVWFAWKTSLKCWWCQWDNHRRIFWFRFLFVSGFATLHCHHWRACCCSRHCTVVVRSFHCLQALNFPHTQLQMHLNGKWCNFHFIVVFVVIPLLLFASCNWSVLPAATSQHNKYDQRRHCERDLPIELSWAEQIRQTGTCAIYFPFWMAGIYLLPRFNFCFFIYLFCVACSFSSFMKATFSTICLIVFVYNAV